MFATIFPYIAILLAQIGLNGKQYSMKKCGTLAPGPFNSICINTMRSVICIIVSLIIWLIADGKATTPFGHLIIAISAVGTAINLFTWIMSSRLISLTLLEAILTLGKLMGPLLLVPVLFKNESVSPFQWVACGLIIVAVFLFVEKGNKKDGSAIKKILLVALCGLSLAVAVVFKKYYVAEIVKQGLGSVEYFTFINFVVVILTFAVLFPIYYHKESIKLRADGSDAKPELPFKRVWLFVILAAASLYLNELFTVYANELDAAIYAPLSNGLNIACTFILDIVVFKDKITVKKIVGLLIVIAAFILLGF
jgi:drug/metabolite transporter (DMT)-like permease